MRKIALAVIGLVLLIACRKLEDPSENPARGQSYLKFIQANPVAPALDVYSTYYNQTNKIVSELSPSHSAPEVGYMQLQSSDAVSSSGVGTYSIHTRPAQTQDTFHLPTPILLGQGEYQTLFSIDSAGKPKLLVVRDNFQKPDSGYALIRFFNANMQAGNLILTTSNAQTSTVNFMQVSDFTSVPTGTYDFVAKDAGGNSVGSISSFRLKNRVAYTFFFSDSLRVTQQTE